MRVQDKLKPYEKYLLRKELAKNTRTVYLRQAQRFLEFMGEREITKKETMVYKQTLMMENKSPASMNLYITALNCYLKYERLENCYIKTVKFQKNQCPDNMIIAEEELLNVMVEQHLYEPDLYLGLADIMIARNHSDSAIDVLVTGYQYTNDEQIKSKLLDLQTRAKVGDGNADKIDQALGLAEDIADDLGYGETVEKGKNVFDTIYGYYLENK